MKRIEFLFIMVVLLAAVQVRAQDIQSTGRDSLQQINTQDTIPNFLPKGVIIHARKDNKIYCFLPENTLIQGVWCRGHLKDWETGFYTNGKLALAWLPRDQIIQGIPCMKASFWTEISGKSAKVQFYDNGQLARCKLAKDFTIEGKLFEKGAIVYFDKQGKLIQKNKNENR